MKALSIRQPFAWAILHAGKDIENRDWPTRFRGTIAVHASKGTTREEYDSAREFMLNVVGLTDVPLVGQVWLGSIIGLVDIVDCVSHANSPWFQGEYGFELANPRPLTARIQCRGALNFWDLPSDIEAQIQEQLQKEPERNEASGFFPGDLIGKTLEEASAYVAPFGYCVRAKIVNGHPAIVTRDYRPDRINVALVYGKITDVYELG